MSNQTATSALGWQNKFSTTLSSSITSSDTTIPLTSVPTPSEGFLVIEPDSSTAWEVIYYTSKTGSAVVCTSALNGRGVDDSTAQSHSSGATVRMDTTAGMFEVLQNGTALAAGAVGTQNLSNPYKFSVYRNAAANSGNGAFALVTFDTKNFDTGTNYSTSTGQFTAPIAGFYQFSWYLQTSQGSGSHNWQANLTKNGTSTTVASGSAGWSANAGNITVGSALLQLASSDTIQVMLYGDTTLGINVTSSTANFQGFLVSAT